MSVFSKLIVLGVWIVIPMQLTYDTLKSDEKYYKKAIKENKLSESFIKSLADKIDKLVKKDKNE